MYKNTNNTKAANVKRNEKPSGFDKDFIDIFKKSGQSYFDELVKYLCEQSNAKYAYVGKYNAKYHNIRTLSFYSKNSYIKNFEYDLENTPCCLVIKCKLCFYPENVQKLFPKDEDLKNFKIESYIGFPLLDLNNNPVGIIVIMDDKPMQFNEQLKIILELFKSKTELELERLLLKENQSLSQEEYIDTFQNFQDIFFKINYNDKNELVDFVISPSVEKTLGYNLEEIKHINFNDFYEDPNKRNIFLQTIRVKKQVKNYPLTFKKKDGSLVYLESDCELIENNLQKNVAFSLRGVLKDITKKYKENLRFEMAYLIAEKSQRRLFNLKNLGEFIYETLKKIINISNFYIVKLNEDKNQLVFSYFKDEFSDITENTFSRHYKKNGFSEYVINSNKIINQTDKELEQTIKNNKLKIKGKIPTRFIGIPLKSEGLSVGAMVVQSYDKNFIIEKEDLELLNFIASQIAVIIDRKLWQDKLIKNEEYFRSLVENSSEIIGIISKEGTIEYISESIYRILKYNPYELIGNNISNYIKIDNLFQQIIQRINNPNNEVIILKIYDKNGKKKYLEISTSTHKSKNQSNRLIFNAKDITDRILVDKKRKNALKHVTDLKNALNFSASVFFTNINGCILDVNKKIELLSGYSKDELIGSNAKIFNSKYHTKPEWKKIWDTILIGKTWRGEIRNQKKDGSYYWVYETISPIFGKSGTIEQFIAIQFDITEEKNAKTNLIREVIEAQERERERFAMEIHDGLGQVLLASKMNLTSINDSINKLDDDSIRIFNSSLNLLTEAVQEARSISHGLMSRVLSNFGLAYAINEIVNNINSSSSVNLKFQNNIENIRFNEEIEMGIYRTLQELIKNIIKHSKATKASLNIIKSKNNLSIEIRDNGVGIKKGTINNPRKDGIGLRNMRSRVEYLGGLFEIDEKIKKGTKIKISISL
jgi:PAS domain S-box-containing protein